MPKCKTLDDIVSDFGDNASFALRILGEIYRLVVFEFYSKYKQNHWVG